MVNPALHAVGGRRAPRHVPEKAWAGREAAVGRGEAVRTLGPGWCVPGGRVGSSGAANAADDRPVRAGTWPRPPSRAERNACPRRTSERHQRRRRLDRGRTVSKVSVGDFTTLWKASRPVFVSDRRQAIKPGSRGAVLLCRCTSRALAPARFGFSLPGLRHRAFGTRKERSDTWPYTWPCDTWP